MGEGGNAPLPCQTCSCNSFFSADSKDSPPQFVLQMSSLCRTQCCPPSSRESQLPACLPWLLMLGPHGPPGDLNSPHSGPQLPLVSVIERQYVLNPEALSWSRDRASSTRKSPLREQKPCPGGPALPQLIHFPRIPQPA